MAFPTTLDSDFGTLVDNIDDIEASQMNEIRRAVEGLEAKIGIDDSLVTTSLDYMVNGFFESGRKMWLYEDAPPTGWKELESIADRVLAVRGGLYNAVGGNESGSWTQPTHTHTGSSHNHQWYNNGGNAANDQTYNSAGTPTNIVRTPKADSGWVCMASYFGNDAYFGGKSPADSYTTKAGTGATGASGTANTWRPYGAVGIIVEKD